MATYTNQTKNTATESMQPRGGSYMTLDEATFTWDEAQGTWDNPYVYQLQTKTISTQTLQSKSTTVETLQSKNTSTETNQTKN